MSDFIRTMYIDVFNDGRSGIFIGLLMWSTTLLIALMFIVGAYSVIDKYGQIRSDVEAIVMSKKYKQMTTNMIPMTVNGVTTYTTHIIPESFNLTVNVKNEDRSVATNKYFFEDVNSGDWVLVETCIGRLSGKLLVTKVLSKLSEEAGDD